MALTKKSMLISVHTLLILLLLLGHIAFVAALFASIYALIICADKAYFKGYLSARMALFFIFSAALLLHKVPGFENIAIYQDVQFSPDALPYSLYLNFDKFLIAVILLPYILLIDKTDNRALPKLPSFLSRYSLPMAMVIISVLTIGLVFVLAFALGLVNWQVKLPDEALIFFVKMLVVTVVAEECIFRGMLQRGLTNKLGLWGVLIISGLFFGAVHAAFSPLFALASVFAGLGYGLVYYYARNIAYPIALHFILNSIHAIFLTYPMLA
ncbi:CPBP family intramembrane glutamic endopeptidase [Colwellia sp. E2M01]|uniref:CPBP family intramembrane glutamic endopeptidase n=1 Tax=Colwellia sp. E2M01 TaxID=2841561 RepID=UPI001C09D578|nr:CPBP family intramembrane glutamic endopeptidase [Colwellia sp. E2M01]MBU2871146.1 CPBP family intramembrane metalloprotease [Colwellia sp. E2M01]